MENKVLVYAVLAISLGFLLVSEVPNQLAPPMFGEPAGESEILRAPGQEIAEAPADSIAAPATEPDGTLSGDAAESQGDVIASDDSALGATGPDGMFSRDAASAQSAASAAESGSGNLAISVFGTWGFNLVIALGVYFIARRRFS